MSIQMIRRFVVSSVLASCAMGMVSCASGPTYAEALKTMPPIPQGKGRVFVYRTSTFGAAIRPQVRIDDQPVGTSKAKGFVYSDQTPGKHAVSLETEWKHKSEVTVAAGQPSFVRTIVTPGAFAAHIIPTSVTKSEGESEIQPTKLVTD